MLNEVLHLTNGAPFAQGHENEKHAKNNLKISCFGCKYDDCEVDEEERKANCLSCLEPVTIRKNYTSPNNFNEQDGFDEQLPQLVEGTPLLPKRTSQVKIVDENYISDDSEILVPFKPLHVKDNS